MVSRSPQVVAAPSTSGSKFFSFVYDLTLTAFAIVTLPFVAYQMLVKKKYRRSFFRRWGFDIPKIEKGNKPLYWVHAVSMGETLAVAALVKRIKRESPDARIVISSITETGHAQAIKTIREADYHVYLPLDISWNIKRLFKRVSPDVLIVCETDLWYQFLRIAKKQGASLILVNGKVSLPSMKRYSIFFPLRKRLFQLFDKFCVQDPVYGERFHQLGIPKDKIVVTGNLKFDDESTKCPEAELKACKEKLGIDDKDVVIVAGSTHNPEEKEILKVFEGLWRRFPKLKLVLVPRHPERFDEVAKLLKYEDLAFSRFSQIEKKEGNERVILVDTMGLLKQCYQLADIAIVAGSYTEKVGGHNILEPANYQVPVIFGPWMQNQHQLQELILRSGGGLQVPIEELQDALERLLLNPKEGKEMGRKGLEAVQKMRGATARTWATVAQTY
jgi:3-deoxy-D-manno-octulosonic-acid transferase